MLKIVVMISGGGSNLQAIIDGIKNGTITNTEILGVVSNNASAYGLERAQKAGLKTYVISPKNYENRSLFNEALLETVATLEPDLVVLSGFLVVLPQSFIDEFRHRIINIHPSLIPAFCGTGFYGLKVHEAALERGVQFTGATVHYVDEGTDTGPIILQKVIPVLVHDTPQSLQKRVMEECEWQILPAAIQQIAKEYA